MPGNTMMRNIESLLKTQSENHKKERQENLDEMDQRLDHLLQRRLTQYLDQYFSKHQEHINTTLAEHHDKIGNRLNKEEEKQAEENWQKATLGEKIIVGDLIQRLWREDQFEILLQGGHIIFRDNGELYQKWTSDPHIAKIKRVSSHHSVDPQWGVEGSFVKEALFGTIIDLNGEKCTWLQLERYPAEGEGLVMLAKHLATYFEYLITRKNQGPYGASPYTERHPYLEGSDSLCDSF